MKDLSLSKESVQKLTVQEAANYLHVSTQTLRRWDESSKLVSIRTQGNQRRYTIKQLRAFKKLLLKKNPRRALQKLAQEANLPQTEEMPISTAEQNLVVPKMDLSYTAEEDLPQEQYLGLSTIAERYAWEQDRLRDLNERIAAYQPPADLISSENLFAQESEEANKKYKNLSKYIILTSAGLVFTLFLLSSLLIFKPELLGASWMNNNLFKSTVAQLGLGKNNFQAVLGAASINPDLQFTVSIPSLFKQETIFSASVSAQQNLTVGQALTANGLSNLNGGITTNNANIDAGVGSVTAANLLYGVKAGSGISISAGQTPTISSTITQTSLQGQTGALTLNAGSGISIDGLKISANDLGSSQNIFKNIAVTGQNTITAGNNNDTLTFAQGAGITLTTDSANKILTIAASAGTGGNGQWLINGTSLYYTGGNIGIGTAAPLGLLDVQGASSITGMAAGIINQTGSGDVFTASSSGVTDFVIKNNGTIQMPGLSTGIAHFDANGILSSSQVALASGDVIGTLPINRGGTNTTYLGQAGAIAYSNGTYYDFTTQGTANQCLVSNGSGAPGWGNCILGVNYWQQGSGAISPGNETNDVLIGNTATSSAAFAFSGVLANTRTASISGNLSIAVPTGVSGSNSLNIFNGGSLSFKVSPGGNSGLNSSFVLNSNGSVQLPNLTTGVAHLSSNGILSSTLIDLTSAADLTGILPISFGGTNTGTLGSAGTVAYSDGTSYNFTVQGNPGQVLISNGSSAPSWVSSGSVGTNYWNEGNGVITPADNSVDLLTGGQSTSSAAFAFIGTTTNTRSASISGNLSLSVPIGNNSGDSVNMLNGGSLSFNLSAGGDSGLASLFKLNSNGSVQFPSLSTGIAHLSNTGVLSSSLVNLAADVTGVLPLANGGTNSNSVGTAGTVVYSNGSSYQFTTAGNLGDVLISNGTGAPTWTSSSSVGVNYWNELAGTVSPKYLSNDLLLGGTSTQSAKFAFLNNSGIGNPTASISGNLALSVPTGANPNAALNVLNGGSLSLQTSPGGDNGLNTALYLAAGGSVGIGNTNPKAKLDISGAVRLGAAGGNNDILNTSAAVGAPSGDLYWGNEVLCNSTGNCVGSGGTVGGNGTANYLAKFTGTFNLGNGDIYDNGNIGIGTTNPLALLHIEGGNTGGNAVAIFNQIGSSNNDIFTASSAGITKFTIANDGTITDKKYSTGLAHINSNGSFSSSAVDLTSSDVTNILPIAKGGTGNMSLGSYGGVAWADTVDNEIAYTAAATSQGQVLVWGPFGYPVWQNSSSVGANDWQIIGGALSPINNANDFLLGSSSTSSAVFAVTKMSYNDPSYIFHSNLSLTVPGGSSGTQTLQILNGSSLTTQTANVGNTSFINDVFDINNNGTISIGQSGGSSTLNVGGTGNFTSNLSIGASGKTALLLTNSGSNTGLTIAGTNGNVDLYNSGSQILGTDNNFSINGGINNGNAALSVNQNGALTNDIFTASSSGVTKFTIANDGTITAGGTAYATGSIGIAHFSASGVLSSGPVHLESNEVTGTLGINDGGTNTTSIGLGGTVVYSDGTRYQFTGVGTTGQCLISNGSGAPAWTNCGSGIWNQASGAIYANNSTQDLLLGGNSTSSAKFAFLNDNSGIPVASISANSTNNATYLSGAGVLGTTNTQTLTLGSSSTGNIIVNPRNSAVGGYLAPATDNVTDLGATGSARFRNLFLGPGSLHIQCTVTEGCGSVSQLYDYALGVNPANNNFAFRVNGNEEVSINSAGTLGLAGASATGGNYITSSNFNVTTAGAVNAASTITGTNINGTTGINSGIGAGTQRIDNNGNLVNIGNITASGTINFTGLGNGVLQASSGLLSATTVGVSSGGTGVSSVGAAGSLAYSNGSSYSFTTAGTTGQCLISNGSSAPTWGSCGSGGGGGTSLFADGNGSIYPLNATEDLFIGGTSTSSAKFAFLNNNTGTPVASISANSGNNATFISGDGYISATNKQNLNFGNNLTYNSTGNLLFNTNGVGYAGFGTTNPVVPLQLTVGGTASVNVSDAGTALLISATNTAGSWSAAAIQSGTTGNATLYLGNSSNETAGAVRYDNANNVLRLFTNGTDKFDINSTGNLSAVGSLSGLTGLASSGTINFSGLGTGAVVASSGILSAGTLSVGNGGTNAVSVGSAGSIAYSTGAAYAFTAVGSTNQCLLSNGSGTPTWGSCGGSSLFVNNATDSTLTRSGSGPYTLGLNLGNANTWTALQTFNGGLTVAGTTNINTSGTSSTNIGTSTNTGNVAIGNSTGTFALTSNGGLNVTTGGALTGVASLDTITTSATALTFANAGSLTASGTNTLTLNGSSTGNIQFFSGSNTLSSAGSLTLAGNISAAGTTGLTLSGNGAAIKFTGAVNNYNSITTANNNNLALLPNGTGNVGIGTTTPGSLLTVAGNISNIANDNANYAPTYVSQNSDSNLNTPYGLFVQGNYVYLTNDNTTGKLSVYNISSGVPVYVGQNSDSNLNSPLAVAVAGRYAYVPSEGTNKLVTYDISTGTPVYVGQNSDANLSNPWDIAVAGRYAYVASYGTNKLVSYDITSGTPVYVGQNSDSNLSNPTAVYVSGRYAYVISSGTNKLSVYDISSGIPVYVGQNSDSNISSSSGVYTEGKYAYVLNSSKLLVYDISSGTPVYVGQNSDSNISSAFGFTVSGRYAFISTSFPSNIAVYDLYSGTPVYIGKNTDSNLLYPRSVMVFGNNIYVANGGDNKVDIYNVGGIQTTSIIAHSAELGNLSIDTNAQIANSLSIGGGLNIGSGGLYSKGSISTNSNMLIQGAGLCVTSNAAGCQKLYAAGTIDATSSLVTGADVAENYVSSQTLLPGEVVAMANDGNSNAVVATTSINQNGLLGVVSTNPGVTVNSGAQMDSTHPNIYPIALVGRIPVRVSSANGPISVGDPLTSSSIPGVAVKATKPGVIIGRALESYTNSDQYIIGTITAYSNVSYYDPTAAQYAITSNGLLAVTNGNSSTSSNTNSVATASAILGDATSSTQSASLTDQVTALQQQVSQNSEQISSLQKLLNQVGSTSASLEQLTSLLASSSALPTNFATGQDLNIQSATISADLQVLGKTTVNDLGVTGNITTGLLTIDGLNGSIDNIAQPLKLQPEALTTIEMEGGNVVIATNGDITTKGVINVAKVNVDESNLSTASVGQGTIKAGSTSVMINTTSVTDKSHIFVTVRGSNAVPLSVATTVSGKSFSVVMPTAQSSDVKFDWWIVN